MASLVAEVFKLLLLFLKQTDVSSPMIKVEWNGICHKSVMTNIVANYPILNYIYKISKSALFLFFFRVYINK